MRAIAKKLANSDYVSAVVEQVPFLSELTAGERIALTHTARCRSYRRDQFVFRAGESADMGAFLLQGLIALTTSGAHQRPLGVEVIAPYQPFGVLAVINKIPYPLSALVLEPSVVLEVPSEMLQKAVERSDQLKSALLTMAASRFCEAQHVIQSLASSSARSRIAYALLLLLRRLDSALPPPHTVNATRKQLAWLGGTTIETAIRTIKQFEKEGLLRMPKPRCIEVLQLQRIQDLAV